MTQESEIICIMCPLGCHIEITSHEGHVIRMTGGKCSLGEKYAKEEYRFPGRILTTTLLTQSSTKKLLPVKSNQSIPKDKLRQCMYHLPQVRVKPPIKRGQVVAHNIANTGAHLIATDDLLE
jgi:CxxC motif-containing protein